MKKLYYQMLRIRMVEEEISRRYPEGKMRCPCHLSIGSEAIAVGVCSILKPDDVIFCHHRCHAAYLAKGGSLNKMIAELYGKATGGNGGHGGSQHLIDREAGILGTSAIVGGILPIALGYAEGIARSGTSQRVVAFCGETVWGNGTIHEVINIMHLRDLPLLIVSEWNGWSTATKIENIQHYGGCKYASYAASSLIDTLPAVSLAEFPGVLHFSSQRGNEHVGPALWDLNANQDPLSHPEYHDVKPELLSLWRKEIQEEINEAFEFAEQSEWAK